MLFFFDHNVSSQLAQQEQFNLKKPPAYHYDFMLLSLMVSGAAASGTNTRHGCMGHHLPHIR